MLDNDAPTSIPVIAHGPRVRAGFSGTGSGLRTMQYSLTVPVTDSALQAWYGN